MRKSSLIQSLLAVVITIAYMVGIFGSDIHRSEDSHRTYVIPLFAGISCERIHPDAPCHHHGEEECDEHEDCCHDTVETLDITGNMPCDVVSVPVCFAQLPSFPTPVETVFSQEHSFVRPAFFYPPPPDLSMMCVLRV